MKITISENKVTLTEWDAKTMFAVSFEVGRNLTLDLFERLLKESKHCLLTNIFTANKHSKKIKSK